MVAIQAVPVTTDNTVPVTPTRDRIPASSQLSPVPVSQPGPVPATVGPSLAQSTTIGRPAQATVGPFLGQSTAAGTLGTVESIPSAVNQVSDGVIHGPFQLDDSPEVWGYSDALNRRINELLKWHSPATSTYAIAKAPHGMFWSTRSDVDYTEFLFDSGRRYPVTLWFVGKLSGVFLFTSAGLPERQANILFQPLRATDLSAGKRLLKAHTSDKLYVPGSGQDSLKAGKWMTKRVPGEAAESVEPFDSVYDATEVFRAKSKMERIRPEDLKRNDLVLVEVFVSRFRDRTITDDFSSPSKTGTRYGRGSSSKAEVKWRATFVLKSINLLHASAYNQDPAVTDEADRSDEDPFEI
ncbi:hypothetical protein CALVIDRAFT_560477 [Calocera viscosa TUFC12733]|uniref:Uncharacterized protein n=1 Tax=Calocera viscosa (strain TUFC12733) TaxID=1330018 RepID=A0A167R349_CALVF|nr:hypothetical protein CALVIDRAFT_560477 [Calocera viscosa TUFC12733]